MRRQRIDKLRRVVAWRALRTEHELLDAMMKEIASAATAGDWREVDKLWDAFASQLGEHLELEEKVLLPLFAASGVAAKTEANKIILEHHQLRATVQALGIAIQVHHRFAMNDVQAFIDQLRAHAEREDRVFYPWVDAHNAKDGGAARTRVTAQKQQERGRVTNWKSNEDHLRPL